MTNLAALRAVPFLARASDDGLQRLADVSVLRRYERGEFLFRTGEPVDRIFVIQSGRVAATVSSPEGARLTFHVAEAGESAGHSSLLDPPGHQASAEALTRVTAVAIPAADCIDLLTAEPLVALDFARELAGIVRVLNESLADLVFLDLERRLARTLAAAPSVGDVVSLGVSQGELAARLGVARQSLNQALSRLAQRGLIAVETPRMIRILDRPALHLFVGDTLGGLAGPSAFPGHGR